MRTLIFRSVLLGCCLLFVRGTMAQDDVLEIPARIPIFVTLQYASGDKISIQFVDQVTVQKTRTVQVPVPYFEEIEQEVDVPYLLETMKDGEKTTVRTTRKEMRTIQVTRTRMETRQTTINVTVPQTATEEFEFENIRLYLIDGEVIEEGKYETLLASPRPAIVVYQGEVIEPYYKLILKPDTLVFEVSEPEATPGFQEATPMVEAAPPTPYDPSEDDN